MRRFDARTPDPLDLRRQLPLHLDERHAPLEAGGDERFP
jgi:hypothetical protein